VTLDDLVEEAVRWGVSRRIVRNRAVRVVDALQAGVVEGAVDVDTHALATTSARAEALLSGT